MSIFQQDLIVTIDGPAGVGKSTVSRFVAAELGYAVLDSGSLYRAITYAALQRSVDLSDETSLLDLIEGLDLQLDENGVSVGGQSVGREIRSREVTANVSQVSSHPCLRSALIALQRHVGKRKRLVAEGRDMGTVIFPEADYKFFLQASLEERARRRHGELAAHQATSTYDRILRDVRDRDQKDESRDTSPLRPADDAVILITDSLDAEAVGRKILTLIRG